MIRRAARPNSHFLVVRNDVVRDIRLSLKATGLLVRILSRPDDWRTDRDSLARECKEGTAAIRSALKELRDAGYMVNTKRRDGRGRWITETVVYDAPQAFPQVTPEAGFQPSGDQPPESPPLYKEPAEVPDEDGMERVDPPSSDRRDDFQNWRTTDLELFKSLVAPEMYSDGSHWNKGWFTADQWYAALRDRKHKKPKPIDWPGKFVERLSQRDGIGEFFGAYGIEHTAA